MVCKKTILNLTLHVTTEPTAGTTCFSSSLMTFIIDFYETKNKAKRLPNLMPYDFVTEENIFEMSDPINSLCAQPHLNLCLLIGCLFIAYDLHFDFFAQLIKCSAVCFKNW